MTGLERAAAHGLAMCAGLALLGGSRQFSSEVQFVEVYATVTDSKGGAVLGLGPSDFDVYEDGHRQSISAFAAGEYPLTVALGVDRSWSMAGRPLEVAKRAAQSFLRSLKPGDRSLVVAIGSDAEVVAPLEMDRVNQSRAVAALDPWSTTALNDAIIVSLNRLEGEPGRRALVVFSDGVDRYSRATAADVLERARESAALVYPIAIGRSRPPWLAELAVLTGGRSFLIRDAGELEKTLATVLDELRHQYLLGYVPSVPIVAGRTGWRTIRVALKDPRSGARVRARDGYRTR